MKNFYLVTEIILHTFGQMGYEDSSTIDRQTKSQIESNRGAFEGGQQGLRGSGAQGFTGRGSGAQGFRRWGSGESANFEFGAVVALVVL